MFFRLLSVLLIISQATLAQMTFQKETDTQRLVVLADENGKNQKIISDPNEDTYHPEISSSGQFLAYSRGKIQQGGQTELEVVIQDLSNNITEIWSPKGNQYIHVEFSGNERFLAFSGPNSKSNKQNIFVIDLLKERQLGPTTSEILNGKTIKKYSPSFQTIESNFDCYAPAVSSDGTLIVYHRTSDKNNKKAPKQLVLFNTKTLKEEILTDENKHAMFPTLSSDDRYVAYVSQDGGQWDIYSIDLWTQTKKQLTNDDEIEFTPSFKDNNEIYFTRFVPEANENQGMNIDIYYLPSKALHSNNLEHPLVFLNDKNIAEYVPSFANSNKLKKETLNSFPLPERSSFGSITHNGVVYIAGGHQGPEHTYPKESFLNIFQAYNTKTLTWTTLPEMPQALHGFQMAAYDNYIYIFGGFSFSEVHRPKWKSVDTIQRYDIKLSKWETLTTKLPRARSSNALAVVDNKVYLIGGWDSTPKFENDKDGKFHSEIDVFDLKTEKIFVSSNNLPPPLRRAFTAVVHNNEIYLLGGIGEGASHFDWIDNVTVFNPITNTWQEKSPLPFATFAPGAGVINDKIYFIGGMVLRDLKTFDLDYVDDIYVFDLNKNLWSHSGVYLNENKGFPQVVELPNSSLGILGGHTYLYSPKGIIDHPVSSFELLKIQP